MQTSNFKNQSGQISKILLILAVVVLVIIIALFFATGFLASKKQEEKKPEEPQNGENTNEPPKPVYEVTIGDVKFTMESADNLGNALVSPLVSKPRTTTEQFIRVMVHAQNKTKTNLPQGAWNLGNMIDSEGRVFPPITGASNFIPQPDRCGAILKPEFTPTPCVKIYEVSNISTGLKVQVYKKGVKRGQESIQLLDLR